MSKIIPLLVKGDEEEKAKWKSALDKVSDNLIREKHGFQLQISPLNLLSEKQMQTVEVAIVANPDPQDLKKLPNLKWVQSLWAGVERLAKQLKDSPVKIVRMTDPELAASMAEAALAWSLYLHRDMPRYKKQQQQKIWRSHEVPPIKDQTIGILGLGKLGEKAAKRLTDNGFNVIGWSRSGRPITNVKIFKGEAGLVSMMQQTRILIILLPLTSETTNLINSHNINQLSKGASIINFARGPIIEDNVLIKALNEQHLNHAVLDVFDKEPLPESHPFWTHPDITVLPHISAPTNKTTASIIAIENISAFLETGQVPVTIDKNTGY